MSKSTRQVGFKNEENPSKGQIKEVPKIANHRYVLEEIGNRVTKVVKNEVLKKDLLKTNIRKGEERGLVTSTRLKPLNLKKDFIKGIEKTLPVPSDARLPLGVKNIDENDKDNILLLSVYVRDVFLYLQSLEIKYPVRSKHLSHLDIKAHMRTTLIDWLVDIQVQFRLMQETFQMSVSILDRYLQNATDVTRNNLQLVGMACLLLASKYEELCPPELNDFVYMANSAFTIEEIKEMECKIIQNIDFNLGKPVPITFLRRYSKAIKSEPLQHAFAKYFVEIALLDYSFASEKPSKIAACAIFIALRLMNEDEVPCNLWNPTITYYSGYALKDFEHLVPKLANCIREVPLSKLKALANKFASSRFSKVSTSPLIGPSSRILKDISEA